VKAIVLSASVVLYKPDLPAVERTLLALQQAVLVAKQHYALRPSLTLIDNSDDPVLYLAITSWFEGFRDRVPDWSLQLTRSSGNVGYGRGNNLAIAHARSDYHAVINPDLFVDADALLEALRFMEGHPDVGLLSPAVVGEDGERHYLCKRNPTLLIMFLRSFAPLWLQSVFRSAVDEFEMRNCDYGKPIHPLEYPTGCFMFFRTAPLQAIGGFDPDFFLHYEEADIGRRILKVARVFYVPSVRVTHRWARDTHRSLQAMLLTARSGLLYWRKWGGVFSSECAEEPIAILARARGNQGPDPATGGGRRVLVTGANGFIGKAVCADLPSRGYRVRGAVRRNSGVDQSVGAQYVAMGEIDEHTDWAIALAGVDCVVHLAARVHLMHETATDPLMEFRRVNVALSLNLARQAAIAGVRRFVFVSSVKVNGESTPFGQPFKVEDMPQPLDPYGISKAEAEQELMQLAQQTGMEVVVLRPVLVYGPGVKANFQVMMRWLRRGAGFLLGALDNRRSLVALDNLVDCIATCLRHPAAANQIFLVSDGEDLTVADLLRRTSTAFNRRAIFIPVPKFVLRVAGRILGREDIVQRLCDTLQVDISKTRRMLDWEPPVSIDASLRKTVQRFQAE
jgi:nucleoside-diphosphate-sugar epimerase/GT2 family glycosyltransferase